MPLRSVAPKAKTRATNLSTLGLILRDQFALTGAMAGLDESIRVHQQALQAIEANHPARALFLLNLGSVLGTVTTAPDGHRMPARPWWLSARHRAQRRPLLSSA